MEAQDNTTLLREAQRIGAPLMIKASAGGGGRGMRRCDDTGDTAALTQLIESHGKRILALPVWLDGGNARGRAVE